jgi:hypothetical protein
LTEREQAIVKKFVETNATATPGMKVVDGAKGRRLVPWWTGVGHPDIARVVFYLASHAELKSFFSASPRTKSNSGRTSVYKFNPAFF